MADDLTADSDFTVTRINTAISNILRLGLLCSATLIIIGGIKMFLQEGAATPRLKAFHGEPSTLTSVPAIVTTALSGSGEAIIQLGVLVLLATPVLRVAFAGLEFLKERDYTYVVIALIVLTGLLWGLFN